MTYTIKTNSSLHAIASMFDDMGRKEQFSLYGLEAIMNYLEETSEDGTIDLDVIAICCYFTEESVEDFIEFYIPSTDKEEYLELPEKALEYAVENTWAIKLDNGNLLYINF